jgi:hypothetical protein
MGISERAARHSLAKAEPVVRFVSAEADAILSYRAEAANFAFESLSVFPHEPERIRTAPDT